MTVEPIGEVAFHARRSVVALLSSIVDYAGLFPPAKLDMATTVRNYASYLDGDDAWMLERLIVPVARLDEFEREAAAQLPKSPDDDPWHLSAITAPAGDDRLAADVERIQRFNERHADPANGLAMIDAVELKGGDSETIDRAIDLVPDELYPFFEIAIDRDPRGLIATLVGGEAGAKIRTGGLTADLHPRPEDVARFIAACAASDVPFKATAGLHAPLRHYEPSVEAEQFGFLNIFIAAALALHRELTANAIHPILVEAGAEAFGDDRLTHDEIEDARLSFAVSFGSCSFDEPLDHLRAMKLIH
jgi:hypothetical protein